MADYSTNFFGAAIDTAEISNDSVTNAKLKAGTQGGIKYAGAGGAWADLAIGASGAFLKSNGAAANPSWAGLGTMVYLGGQTLGSNGTTLSASGLSTSTYSFLKVVIIAKGDSATNSSGTVRFNSDAGNNYTNISTTGGGAYSVVTGASSNDVGLGFDNSGFAAANFEVFNIAASTKIMFGISNSFQDGNLNVITQCDRWENVADNISSIVVTASAGNFLAGSLIQVWGAAT